MKCCQAILLLITVVLSLFISAHISSASDKEKLDKPIEEYLEAARDLAAPLPPIVSGAVNHVIAAKEIDDIDNVLLGYMTDNMTGGGATSSDRFWAQQRSNQAYNESLKLQARAGVHTAIAGQAAQAAGMAALAEAYGIEAKNAAARARRKNLVRLRAWYKQGLWEDVLDKEASSEIDKLIVARAYSRAAAAGLAMTDEIRTDSIKMWSNGMAGIDLTPLKMEQSRKLYHEASSWYHQVISSASAGERQKLAMWWLPGALSYLHFTQNSLSNSTMVEVAKECIDVALVAKDDKLYTDAVFSLETLGTPAAKNHFGSEEAFLLAGLYMEKKGDVPKAAEVWRAYLDEYAGFNTEYRAKARFKELATQKLGQLGNVPKRVSKNWGINARDLEKVKIEAEKDIKRKDMGLEF